MAVVEVDAMVVVVPEFGQAESIAGAEMVEPGADSTLAAKVFRLPFGPNSLVRLADDKPALDLLTLLTKMDRQNF
jgi:hypothetical protein